MWDSGLCLRSIDCLSVSTDSLQGRPEIKIADYSIQEAFVMNFTKLTNFLDSLPAIGIPGVDCIVKQGYNTIFRHQAGYADREKQIPMNGTESFFLYSSSKPIT